MRSRSRDVEKGLPRKHDEMSFGASSNFTNFNKTTISPDFVFPPLQSARWLHGYSYSSIRSIGFPNSPAASISTWLMWRIRDNEDIESPRRTSQSIAYGRPYHHTEASKAKPRPKTPSIYADDFQIEPRKSKVAS